MQSEFARGIEKKCIKHPFVALRTRRHLIDQFKQEVPEVSQQQWPDNLLAPGVSELQVLYQRLGYGKRSTHETWDEPKVFRRKLAAYVAKSAVLSTEQRAAIKDTSIEVGKIHDTDQLAFLGGFALYSHLLRDTEGFCGRLPHTYSQLRSLWQQGGEALPQSRQLATLAEQTFPVLTAFAYNFKNTLTPVDSNYQPPAYHPTAKGRTVLAGMGFAYQLHAEELHGIALQCLAEAGLPIVVDSTEV